MYFDPTAFYQGDCNMREPHAPEELSGAASFLRKRTAPRGCQNVSTSQLSVSRLENGLYCCMYSAWHDLLYN